MFGIAPRGTCLECNRDYSLLLFSALNCCVRKLLVASIRSREAYLALLKIGVGAITIPPRLFSELLDHPATLEAERAFLADAETL